MQRGSKIPKPRSSSESRDPRISKLPMPKLSRSNSDDLTGGGKASIPSAGVPRPRSSSIENQPATSYRPSEARKSTACRLSTAAPNFNARFSSIGGKKLSSGGQGAARDQIVVDKKETKRATDEILHFLLSLNYHVGSNLISLRVLQVLSSKEFMKIFELFCEEIGLKVSFSKEKLEDLVPRVMKVFGYRFTPSRSVLSSIGSAQYSSTAVALLHYLMSMAKMGESERPIIRELVERQTLMGNGDFLEGDRAELLRKRCDMLFGVFPKAYEDYMATGKEDFSDVFDEFIGQLREASAEKIGKLKAEKDGHNKRLEFLQSQGHMEDELIRDRERIKNDIQQLIEYTEKIELYDQKLKQEIAQLNQEIHDCENETEQVREQEQGLRVTGRRSLPSNTRFKLSANNKYLEKECAAIEKHIAEIKNWQMKVELDIAQNGNQIEEIDSTCVKLVTELNPFLRELPITVRLPQSLEDFDDDYSPHMKEIREQIEQIIQRLDRDRIETTQRFEEVQEAISTIHYQIADKERELKLLQEKADALAKEHEDATQRLQAAISDLENALAAKGRMFDLAAMEKENVSLVQKLEDQKSEHDRELRETEEMIIRKSEELKEQWQKMLKAFYNMDEMIRKFSGEWNQHVDMMAAISEYEATEMSN